MPDTSGKTGVEHFEAAAAKVKQHPDSAKATYTGQAGTGNPGVAANAKDGNITQQTRGA